MSHNIENLHEIRYSSFLEVVMRKVDLRMNEQMKFEVIKNVVNGRKSKQRAEVELDLSRRQIDRLVVKYLKEGKYGFIHGNRDRKPITAISKDLKDVIVDLYETKYFDCTYTLFTELLAKRENIYLAVDTVRKLLLDNDILSPKVHKRTRKRIKLQIRKKLKETKTKQEKAVLQAKLIDAEDAHPTQPRCCYFGEEIQVDACIHEWFGDKKSALHAGIDDSTGRIMGAYFDKQETLNGYYNLTYQMLTKYGIPCKIKADRRTVFEYKKKGIVSDENDTFTQYSYAAKQLGIQIETSSVPEFKARIERLFGTLQNRLNVFLRLHNVTSIDEANSLMPQFIEEYNEKFALPIQNTKNVFIKQLSKEKINLTLAVLSRRTIDSGHAIQFRNKYYKLTNSRGTPIFFAKGTKCMVIEAFDKRLFATVDEYIFALEEIPKFMPNSPIFDEIDVPKQKYIYIPKMIHPWKAASFEAFLEKQMLKMSLEKEIVQD